MGFLHNVKILYIYRFTSSLIMAYVIERLFWEARGMTVQMVVYTEIIYAAALLLLEVPSGIVADRWGRKRMIVLAALFGALELAVLLLAQQFWHFALVVLLAAVSRAASSGAENALLYDSLACTGQAAAFEKHVGRINAVDITATIIAALCGSLLASRFELTLNYWLSLCSMLLAVIAAIALREPTRQAGESASGLPLRAYVTASLRFFRDNPGVSLVVASAMVIGASVSFVDEFWQLYLERLHVPVLYFGSFSAALYAVRLPGNIVAHALKERFSYRAVLLTATAGLVVGFACMALLPGVAGLAALLAVGLFAGVMEPLAAGYLHHRIEDASMRATLDSFQSLGYSGALAVIGLGFGWWAARLDIFGGFGFIAVVCGLLFVSLLALSRKALEER